MERTGENITTVERQVGRFKAMNFGCNDDRSTELSDVFLNFGSPEDVSRAVTYFIRTTEETPSVVAVLNYKTELDRKARSTLKAADPNCDTCDGTGWKQVKRRGVEAVEICPCRLKAAA